MAAAVACSAALALAACSQDEEKDEGKGEGGNAPASSAAAPVAPPPTAEELNAVLVRAADPNLPMDQRVKSVQGGENAADIFARMTQIKEETGANFQVVPPILPGYTPNEVLATVNLTQPDQGPSKADNVTFVYEEGQWKLSQMWACTLIKNTLPPEEVPGMCADTSAAPAPAPANPAPQGDNADTPQAPAQGGAPEL
ncbi:hypothetical protein [Corynebacterium aquatimens]|nr:hypothetical protein [Corynebacterium aquatimens]